MRAGYTIEGGTAMSPEAWLPVAFGLGYLLGSIPFGLILTKLAGTQDLRSIGSGNIGATNVLRTGNKGLAAATLICDMLKGTLAVVLARRGGVLRAVDRDRGNLPLLVALGAGCEFCDADFPVVVRPSRSRLAVRRADPAAVLHAPRKHQAVAGGHRGTDRREVRARRAFLVIPGLRPVAHPQMCNCTSGNDGT